MKFSQKSIFLFLLGIYCFGAPFSQALMSTASTLLMLFWGFHLLRSYQELKAAPINFSKAWVGCSLAYVLWLMLGILIRDPSLKSLIHIREVPLFLLPTLAVLPSFGRDVSLSPQELRMPFLVCMASTFYSVIFLVFETMMLDQEGTGVMRSSIYTSYNLLPIFTLSTLMICYPFSEGGLWKYGPRILAALSFLGIFLTGSRGATFTGLILLIFLFAERIRYILKNRVWLGATLLGMALFSGLIVYQFKNNSAFQKRYSGILAPLSIPSVKYRLQIWDYNFYLFQKNPLLGVGYKKNGMVAKRYKDNEFPGRKYRFKLKGYHAHNVFLQSLAESGIIGFALFLGWLFLPALIDRRSLPFVAAIAIGGLNEAIFFNSRVANSFFCFLLMTLVYLSIAQKRSARL